jgi:hypothetical protein
MAPPRSYRSSPGPIGGAIVLLASRGAAPASIHELPIRGIFSETELPLPVVPRNLGRQREPGPTAPALLATGFALPLAL